MVEKAVDELLRGIGDSGGGTYPDAPPRRTEGGEREQVREKQIRSNTDNTVVRKGSQRESWVRAGVL